MSGFLLSIDQGTTGSTAMLLSPSGEVLGRANHEFPQHFPRPGWVEHDLDEIWKSVGDAVRDAIARAGVPATDCLGIGITNQRETTVLWDRNTGKAVHKAIVWQDRRTADRCQELKEAGKEPMFRQRTGLVLDPYLAGTKLEWLLDHVDGARARAEKGELAFGTIDSWLVYRLSGGKAHVTDASNASRTLFYDIGKGRWDEELAAVLRVPMALLPEVRSCSEVYAHSSGVPGLPDGIPIAGMAGDQQAALFGQTCFEVGDAKCTYGTGAFLLTNTGTSLVHSENGLLTTIAWRLGEQTVYALEGSAFIAGAAVQWLRDGLGLISSSDEIESKAREVDESGDVVFVPALAGLGAPYWDPHARGLIYGLTRDTTAAHLARATLEGIAFQIVDLVDAMQADAGRPIKRLRVDGGAARNDLLMQFESDMLGVTIDRPENVETTALGAAYLAGMAVGVFSGLDSVLDAYRIERSFEPQVTQTERDGHLERWRDAVRRARSTMGIT
ncbi:MAG: glycerol kinase GlpK [Polyangiales bacterium]